MRSRFIAILACVAALAVAVLAHLATWEIAEAEKNGGRYLQHEEAVSLDDLSDDDRAAASSTSTDAKTFASHLPVLSIETGGVEIPGGPTYDEDGHVISDENGLLVPSLAADGSDSIRAVVREYNNAGGINRLSDDPVMTSECLVRVRGNSSRRYDKKNYRLVLVESDETDNDQTLLGMDKCETWVLHGPAIDKSLIRNYLVYSVAGQYMSEFVPDVRFFELFIDDEYMGLYLAVESIKVEEGRVELNESGPDQRETSYLLALDEVTESTTTISNFLLYTRRTANYLDILYPNEDSLTEEQRQYIEQDVSDWEKSLYSYDYDTLDYGYWTTLDVQSFVDMFILNEFTISDDFGAYSTYLYKDVRGLVTLGPAWDYDNTFDNYAKETPSNKFYIVERAWYYMLFKDEDFCERVIDRYRELREGVLSEEYLMGLIDATVDYLGSAVDRNWERWGYTFGSDVYIKPAARRPGDFDEAIDDLKEFIVERGSWLDSYIVNLRQYSHESAVKKFNH